MDIINTIFDIEDKNIEVDRDWYYHGFSYDEEKFRSILKDGLKASILRKDDDSYGDNGKYYICLSKNKRIEGDKSSYFAYYYYPRFIIDKNIIAFPALSTNDYPDFLHNTFLPFRVSDYLDEYQAFLKIRPSKIIGISYNLYQKYDREKLSLSDLEILRNIVLNM